MERSQLSTCRSIGAFIVNIAIMVILPMLCFYSDNRLLGSRLFKIALIMGVAGYFSFLILLKGTTQRFKADQPEAE